MSMGSDRSIRDPEEDNDDAEEQEGAKDTRRGNSGVGESLIPIVRCGYGVLLEGGDIRLIPSILSTAEATSAKRSIGQLDSECRFGAVDFGAAVAGGLDFSFGFGNRTIEGGWTGWRIGVTTGAAMRAGRGGEGAIMVVVGPL